MIDEILTIEDVATYLKVTKKTIYRLVSSKRLPGFKVAGVWRFKKSELEHWISAQSSDQGKSI